ncbi:MAG: hypothetical protein QF903_11920 [Planctomycetota bacterium]|jgi:hypothetical protein|nr:hypothetical protein [Planctomycetota bacterium]MDP6761657.1 hypothetical protein [Planctomycetota bacterium]MDP6990168.1 hypothetical protein [Planctomycetota bacterium]
MTRILRRAVFAFLLVGAVAGWTPGVGAQDAPAAGPPPAAAPNARSPLGINLAKIRDYSPEIVFVDLFRTARAWASNARGVGWDDAGPLDLDEHGWVRSLRPGQRAETPLFTGFGPHIPLGTTTCLFEGTGRIEFKGARVLSERPGRIEVRFDPQAPVRSLRITATDPDDYLRNIRLILPGFLDTYRDEPFHPAFLERWRAFGVLRFMDWMQTNGSMVERWSQRPTLAHHSQGTERGVALELMVELANTLGAEPWFCMPHAADDEYVRAFASQVAALLDPSLSVWIEYSNELWNGQFPQARYARERGLELELAEGASKAGHRYTARRAVEIFALWEEAFGGTERLVRVLAGQSAVPRTAETILGFEGGAAHADVYAIAPYFGGRLVRKESERVREMGLEGLMVALRDSVDLQAGIIAKNVAALEPHELPLVAYEGGQGVFAARADARDAEFLALLADANRHPAMAELYAAYLAAWKEAGGTRFVHFSSMSRYGKSGSWGALERHDQDPLSVPKYRALVDFIAGQPRWWERE